MSESIDPVTGEPFVPPTPPEEEPPFVAPEPTPIPVSPPTVVREIATEEDRIVSDYSAERYPVEEFTLLGEVPEGVHPTHVKTMLDGSIVVDYSDMDAPLHAKIDNDAGEFRCNFITNTVGQEATYLKKEQAARDFLADPSSNPKNILVMEAEIRGITTLEMAQMVVDIADQWSLLNDAIEAQRIAAKLAVTAATTPEAKKAAADVDWWGLIQ